MKTDAYKQKSSYSKARATKTREKWLYENDEELLELVASGASDFDIAIKMGRSINSIEHRKIRIGVANKMPGDYDHKKVFGAGFHAGIKAANEKGSDMAISAEKAKIFVEQQSGIVKKVYECVPINESFDAARICVEMKRMGSTPDVSIVKACLIKLKDAGLVAEVVRGMYQRIRVKDEIKKAHAQLTSQQPLEAEQSRQSDDPLDNLAAAALTLRNMSASMSALASAIEDAALQMGERATENSGEVKKLRQLAELIKTL